MTTPDVPMRLEFEIEVPGSPEQVWEAVATAAGISAWFLPTDSEERLGGRLITHMGPEDAPADITAWEPPYRFAYAEDIAAMMGKEGEAVTPLTSEFLVEARSGGTCVVRVVSSGFGVGAAWEQEFIDDMAADWLPFFEQLKVYLTHFPGQRATTFTAQHPVRGSRDEIQASICQVLGVDGPGSRVEHRDVTGTVEQLDPVLLLRLDAPVPGMVRIGTGGPAGADATEVMGYLFPPAGADPTAVAEVQQATWSSFLAGLPVATPS